MSELQQTDYSSLDLSLSFELCEKYRRTEYKRKVKKNQQRKEKKTTPSKRMLAQTNKEHKRGGKCLNKEQRK